MKLSQKLFLFAAIVVSIFAGLSDAKLTKALMQTAEAEIFLASKVFQDLEEAVIMKGSDKSSLVAKTVIQGIKDEASKYIADGFPALAVKAAMDGSLAAVRLVAESERKAITAIDAAMDVLDTDPEAASDAIKNGIKVDTEIIFVAGVPIHDAQGSILALVGGEATPGLKKTIISIQKAGTAILETLEMAEKIAVLGMEAGGDAALQGLKAAHETVATGGITCYVRCFEAAHHGFNSLKNITSKGLTQSDLVPGIIDSLKTNITINSPAALAAIARVNDGLKSILKDLTKKSAIDAANVMSQGIILTLMQTAEAVAVATESLGLAGKLAAKDVEAASKAVRKGMKVAKDEVISGSAGAYLGFGAAGQICGEKAVKGLVPAVIEFEYGRVTAFEEMRLAEQTALIGIESGALAALQSTFAAVQICESAGNVLYTELADAADLGFAVFRTI